MAFRFDNPHLQRVLSRLPSVTALVAAEALHIGNTRPDFFGPPSANDSVPTDIELFTSILGERVMQAKESLAAMAIAIADGNQPRFAMAFMRVEEHARKGVSEANEANEQRLINDDLLRLASAVRKLNEFLGEVKLCIDVGNVPNCASPEY